MIGDSVCGHVQGTNVLWRPRNRNRATYSPAAIHLRGRKLDHEIRLPCNFSNHSNVVTQVDVLLNASGQRRTASRPNHNALWSNAKRDLISGLSPNYRNRPDQAAVSQACDGVTFVSGNKRCDQGVVFTDELSHET